MDQSLSLSWTIKQAASKARAYRAVSRVAMLIEAAIAVAALIVPSYVAALASGELNPQPLPPHPPEWVRAWAVLSLLLLIMQAPAALDAPRRRWLNLNAVTARLVQAIAYALLGLISLAAIEAVLFVLLSLLLYRSMTAVLMSRP